MGAVLSAGLASHLSEVARNGQSVLTPERAAELAANPNALIEPQARATLPPGVLDALQDSFATAIHRVFWVGTALAALAMLVTFWLPRSGESMYSPPSEEACCAETGERMMIAELATLDPEHEPAATHGD
jgi:CubicO group peptidase (beta-lactamase class C family)